MTQRRRWLHDDVMRELFALELPYDEIARLNSERTGWRPSHSSVSRKRSQLGFDSRRRDANLNPWRGRVLAEHRDHELRRMLGAEERRRAYLATGQRLSRSDKSLSGALNMVLFGGDVAMVVAYDRGHAHGFHLVPRQDTDADIVRFPAPDQDDRRHGVAPGQGS